LKVLRGLEPDETEVPTPKPTPKPEDNSPWVPDKYEEEYKRMYAECQVRKGNEYSVIWYLNRINAGKDKYVQVADTLEMPWQVIGIIHGLEGGFRWDTYLGNGEPLNRKTRLVPKGRGPFSTWEEGAFDALYNDTVTAVPNWTLAETLYYLERFNGMGYRGKKDYLGKPVFSPYLWGLSNKHLYGKYVRDGIYDPRATTKQAGAALLMKELGLFS
jgi:lysozyme family protein